VVDSNDALLLVSPQCTTWPRLGTQLSMVWYGTIQQYATCKRCGMSFPYLYVLDPNELHSSVLSDTWKFPLESVESGNMKHETVSFGKHAVQACCACTRTRRNSIHILPKPRLLEDDALGNPA